MFLRIETDRGLRCRRTERIPGGRAARAGRGMEATLKKELRRQMASTAYLEADYDRFFLEVAHAIDTIQWLGRKVGWITAKTREEWSRKGAPGSEIAAVDIGSIRDGGVLKRAGKDRRDYARKAEIRAHPTVGGVGGSGIWPGATGGQNDHGIRTINSLF